MTAWLKYFVFNVRYTISSKRVMELLNVKELNEATTAILKASQARAFSQEVIKDLKVNRSVDRCSILCTLNPFLDEVIFYELGVV